MNKVASFFLIGVFLIGLVLIRVNSIIPDQKLYNQKKATNITTVHQNFKKDPYQNTLDKGRDVGYLIWKRTASALFDHLGYGAAFSNLCLNIIIDSLTCFLLVLLVYNTTQSFFPSVFSLFFYIYSSTRYEVYLVDEGPYSQVSLFGVCSLWFILLSIWFYNSHRRKNKKKNIHLFYYILLIIFYSILAAFSVSLRPNLLFSLIPIYFGIFAAFRLDFYRSFVTVLLSLTVFIITYFPNASSNYERFGSITRPGFHTVFIGIGGHPNPWGVKQIDKYAFELAKKSGIKIPYETAKELKEYDNFLKKKYFEYVRESPVLFIRNAIINNIQGFVRYGIVHIPQFSGLSKAVSASAGYLLIAGAFFYYRQQTDKHRLLLMIAAWSALFHVSSVCMYYVAATHYLYSYIAINIFMLSLGLHSINQRVGITRIIKQRIMDFSSNV